MSQSGEGASPDATGPALLESAFQALRNYDTGSGRAALRPIDEAVRRALSDAARRGAIEQRLLLLLQAHPSGVAKEYICAQLALIGSDRSVAALAEQLSDPVTGTSARNALEKIPGKAASRALRRRLSSLQGTSKVGVIQSLGARRDPANVRSLVVLLRHSEVSVVVAAAGSLAAIGNVKAAAALNAFVSRAPESVHLKVAQAALACADRLLAEGHSSEARELYLALSAPAEAAPVREAACRKLKISSQLP